MERENAWKKYDTDNKKKEVMEFASQYTDFLSNCKTERECTSFFADEASRNGFANLRDYIKSGKKIKAGDKLYITNQDKEIALFVIGKKPMEEGLSILGAHIDSPRLDLKQNPLYEDTDMALFDTHYYGGVKKYQWVTIPLALHGVVAKTDGTSIKFAIGEAEDDPVFCISDLLIHLAADQMDKKASKVVEGEDLNVLVGSIPFLDKDALDDENKKKLVKANIMKIVIDYFKSKDDNYDFSEEDFLSCEVEVVPAGRARDMGIDRSMILGYGHDDRVCAYPSFRAIVEASNPDKTLACLLVDKEEVGSVGATGMHSMFFENAVAELCNLSGTYSDIQVRRAMSNSKALSSDVSAAFDPNYNSAFEKNNSAYFGRGVVFNKYTGARGKSGSNDASAEFVGEIRGILNSENVNYQTAELGKVDQGGGGTIAYILGNYNMKVIDSGVAVLSMHAPWEIISKVDLYEAYLCYKAFLKKA